MNWTLLEQTLLGNTLRQWSIAGALFVVVVLACLILRNVLGRRLEAVAGRTQTAWDDHFISLLRGTRLLFFVILGAVAASYVLALPPKAQALAKHVAVIALVVQAALWGNAIIRFWVEDQKKRQFEANAAAVTTANLLGFMARLVLYSVVLLMVLDNLGIDVTAMVASLGIGGIAVALAVQNVLADLFACLSISLDKPFVIGDFIIVGDLLGTVEHIGLKTTRLRSISGEQLIFSNNDLLGSRIRNFKRMYERRVVFAFGVVYQTPAGTLEKIPGMVREIVEQQEDIRFDRAHFKAYGDSSLDFEVVYFVLKPDYALYMDIQQAINLALYRRFEQEGIEFAYPTRTLYINKAGGEKPV
jgi:small-conductance mechanosensitive channel